MRDLWYGDKRDLVKWATLVGLAQRYQMRHILQVLYYRKCTWQGIEIDGENFELPQNVIEHFRDVSKICAMKGELAIEVVQEAFSNAGRKAYFETVKAAIEERSTSPGIVFLDPDTGLEPRAGADTGHSHRCKAKSEHVCEFELANLWKLLSGDDLLVFYQHRIRERGWREAKRKQFARALGLRDSEAENVRVAFADRIANDVAFYFLQKPS